MTLIAHISDLHFGRVQPGAEKALLESLSTFDPALVVISGDLTQRALARQFRAARLFLSSLRWPYLVLPGNHDLPLHRPLRRALSPLANYHRYITQDEAPRHIEGRMAVFGLNTTMRFLWKGGGAPRPRLDRLRQDLGRLPAGPWRILVTHHPVFPGTNAGLKPWQAQIAALAREYELDLVLSGHDHHASIRPWPQSGMLAVEAGTAISDRLRSEPNSYNLIRLDGECAEIIVLALSSGIFHPVHHYIFQKEEGAWLEAK